MADRSVSSQDVTETLSRLDEDDETHYEQPCSMFDELAQRSRYARLALKYPYEVNGDEPPGTRVGQRSSLPPPISLARDRANMPAKGAGWLDGTELLEGRVWKLLSAQEEETLRAQHCSLAPRAAWKEDDEAIVSEPRFATARTSFAGRRGRLSLSQEGRWPPAVKMTGLMSLSGVVCESTTGN